ncbi:unnamed protein product [Symbiodinium necroappetens]|uniref:Uncharacterized protein n=1 Tax=Symbiodinium necroappetens TaxID=1628268 RepID=A0A812LQZ3_9DINO|nr:unnamed protein product [Symbiodinium necroappetens]
MADLTREELRAVMVQLGEQPPRGWTKVELAFRISELTGEDMSVKLKGKNKDKSPLQELTQRLNAAARERKSALISFCEKELRMSNLDSWTVSRIQMAGMQRVMELTEGDFRDTVSFGKHGLLTYQELYDQDQSYCRWVVQTARDRPTESDPRLRRLARWIERQDDAELQPDSPTKPGQTILALLHKSGSAQSAPTTLATSNRDERIDTLTAMTKELQAEVEALKAERCQEPVCKKGKDQDTEIEGNAPTTEATTTSQPSSMATTRGPKQPSTMMATSGRSSQELRVQSLEGGSRLNEDYKHETCDQLLNMFKTRDVHGTEAMSSQKFERSHYVVLGAYSHGNHYGITSKTEKFPEATRYLLGYMKHWNGESPVATTLVINLNRRCQLHRDLHNDKAFPNCLIGVSKFEGGRLWVENLEPTANGSTQNQSRKVLPTGEEKQGTFHEVCREVGFSLAPLAGHL